MVERFIYYLVVITYMATKTITKVASKMHAKIASDSKNHIKSAIKPALKANNVKRRVISAAKVLAKNAPKIVIEVKPEVGEGSKAERVNIDLVDVLPLFNIELDNILLEIISHLQKFDSLDEKELAEKLGREIKFIRSYLYTLQSKGLLTYEKVKENELEWFRFVWKVDPLCIERIERRKKQIRDNILNDLKELRIRSHSCKKKCIRMNQEEALELNFKCPNCGDVIVELNLEEEERIYREKLKGLE